MILVESRNPLTILSFEVITDLLKFFIGQGIYWCIDIVLLIGVIVFDYPIVKVRIRLIKLLRCHIKIAAHLGCFKLSLHNNQFFHGLLSLLSQFKEQVFFFDKEFVSLFLMLLHNIGVMPLGFGLKFSKLLFQIISVFFVHIDFLTVL